jgi:Autophagy-related protein C terminal domain
MSRGGGVAEGLSEGAQNFAGGLYEGVSGIFTTPVRGAKQGGVTGFLRGVGHGVVGAVVKPVVSVLAVVFLQ